MRSEARNPDSVSLLLFRGDESDENTSSSCTQVYRPSAEDCDAPSRLAGGSGARWQRGATADHPAPRNLFLMIAAAAFLLFSSGGGGMLSPSLYDGKSCCQLSSLTAAPPSSSTWPSSSAAGGGFIVSAEAKRSTGGAGRGINRAEVKRRHHSSQQEEEDLAAIRKKRQQQHQRQHRYMTPHVGDKGHRVMMDHHGAAPPHQQQQHHAPPALLSLDDLTTMSHHVFVGKVVDIETKQHVSPDNVRNTHAHQQRVDFHHRLRVLVSDTLKTVKSSSSSSSSFSADAKTKTTPNSRLNKRQRDHMTHATTTKKAGMNNVGDYLPIQFDETVISYREVFVLFSTQKMNPPLPLPPAVAASASGKARAPPPPPPPTPSAFAPSADFIFSGADATPFFDSLLISDNHQSSSGSNIDDEAIAAARRMLLPTINASYVFYTTFMGERRFQYTETFPYEEEHEEDSIDTSHSESNDEEMKKKNEKEMLLAKARAAEEEEEAAAKRRREKKRRSMQKKKKQQKQSSAKAYADDYEEDDVAPNVRDDEDDDDDEEVIATPTPRSYSPSSSPTVNSAAPLPRGGAALDDPSLQKISAANFKTRPEDIVPVDKATMTPMRFNTNDGTNNIMNANHNSNANNRKTNNNANSNYNSKQKGLNTYVALSPGGIVTLLPLSDDTVAAGGSVANQKKVATDRRLSLERTYLSLRGAPDSGAKRSNLNTNNINIQHSTNNNNKKMNAHRPDNTNNHPHQPITSSTTTDDDDANIRSTMDAQLFANGYAFYREKHAKDERVRQSWSSRSMSRSISISSEAEDEEEVGCDDANSSPFPLSLSSRGSGNETEAAEEAGGEL